MKKINALKKFFITFLKKNGYFKEFCYLYNRFNETPFLSNANHINTMEYCFIPCQLKKYDLNNKQIEEINILQQLWTLEIYNNKRFSKDLRQRAKTAYNMSGRMHPIVIVDDNNIVHVNYDRL